MINIKSLTNRIIYNRTKRGLVKILRRHLFELNDSFTADSIKTDMRLFLNRVKQTALNDYTLYIHPYDTSKPHDIEIDVTLYFKNMIEQVLLNIKNEDYL